MKLTWKSFDRFNPAIDRYMPVQGEGITMASQICTAVNKLIYKWFNDGDVYDNRYSLSGWCNDLSSYANFLYLHADDDKEQEILRRIERISTKNEYTRLLYDLAEIYLDEDRLARFDKLPRFGSIYECSGRFAFDEDRWG